MTKLTILLVLSVISVFVMFYGQSAYATVYFIHDSASCLAVPGNTWAAPNTCIQNNVLNLVGSDALIISNGTVYLDNNSINANVSSFILNSGEFVLNSGVVFNIASTLPPLSGIHANFTNLSLVQNHGTITTSGTGLVVNNGKINNFCSSTFSVSTLFGNSPINGCAQIHFDSVSYINNQTATVTVINATANVNNSTIDFIPIKFTSSSDPVGFTTFIPETGPSTGIFATNVLLTNLPTSVGVLHVAPADTIFANYETASGIAHMNGPPVLNYPSLQNSTTGSLVTISGSATDPDGDPITYSWSQISGIPVILMNATSGNPQFVAPGIPGAVLQFHLIASDGINPSVSTTIQVVLTSGDTTPPILSILSPPNGATTGTQTVLVSGTASDNVAVSSVTYKIDSGSVSTASTSDSFAHWSFTTPLLSNGAHTIFVNATDSSSNTVTNSTTVTVSTTGVGAVATSLLPVAFTSDSFYIESSGGVSIYDPTIAGTGTLSVTVNSATGYSVPITLVESTTTPGLFTSPYSILFTAGPTNTLDPTTLQLNVSPGTNAVSLSYASPTTSVTNTAYANILVPPTSITVGTAIQFAPSYDTTCSTQGGDTDGDGICDNWEKQGLLVNGKKLVGLWINTGNGYVYKYPVSGTACPPAIDDSSGNPPQNPADPTTMPTCPQYNKKDIYVEVDYMSGHKPDRGALAQVVNAFAAHNIQLHIQVDEDLGFHANKIPLDASVTAPTDPNAVINGQNVGFRQLKDAHFGTVKERTTAGSNLLNMENDKRQIFHYAMFIHDLQDAPGSSGYAEILGNDFIVSLGDFTNEIGNPDEQAGTFMHELGHNLGLRHGGFEDGPNCKPNYLSVMNYAFQFQNLVSGRPLDYSESTLPQLDEVNGLSESAGIGQSTPSGLVSVYGPVTGTVPFDKPLVTSPLSSTSNPVNWNRDSPDVVDSNVQLPVHEIGIPDCQDSTLRVLNGNNDWNSINLVMRTSSTFSDGIYTNPQSPAITEIKATTLNTIDSITGYVPPPATPAQISIGPIVVSTNVTAVNSAITTSVKFIDVDHSSHTASWNWGDGVTSTGVVSQESSNAHPNGQITGSHSYAKAGIYTVIATVRDSTGASTGTSSYQFVIVYDPNAGSLKGEGKYPSPMGALASDPTVAGSARFEFDSHYDKKSKTPSGDFNFELKTGKDFDNDKNTDKLHFKSQSYQWLVVSGNKAEVKGTGTIDGKGNYGFTITVIDVNSKNQGQDLIRIKIWDSSNNVIYDTQPGDPLNADPVIPLKSDHLSIYKDGESDHDRDQRRR